ncbi:unnamed protein product [Symbiodinium natans]|uniref:Uncharacterized protein n=1 Tax=Symbiodinium natans TaxID=878477 RepID=A0A812I3C8_9DINO|nr:unnamed protein product [Symbiodinium natans]
MQKGAGTSPEKRTCSEASAFGPFGSQMSKVAIFSGMVYTVAWKAGAFLPRLTQKDSTELTGPACTRARSPRSCQQPDHSDQWRIEAVPRLCLVALGHRHFEAL